MNTNGARGSGRTTRVMLAAPKGAYYVWCNDNILYPRLLARHLGRDDLVIVPQSFIRMMRGMRAECVVDHAAVALPIEIRERKA